MRKVVLNQSKRDGGENVFVHLVYEVSQGDPYCSIFHLIAGD